MQFICLILTFFLHVKCRAFQLPGNYVGRRWNVHSLNMVKERITAMEAIMDFNRDFKAGLKFILIPQDKLKENAKAAQSLKDQLLVPNDVEMEYGPVDPTYLSRVELYSRGEMTPPPSDIGSSIQQFIPETFPSSSNSFSFSEGMSVPDITILKETLSKALPDKSPVEISEMTQSLVQITTSVQERSQKLIDTSTIANVAKDMPDISGALSEKYQQLLPIVTDGIKDTSRVLIENLQGSQEIGQEISRKFGENYQQAQHIAGDSYQQASKYTGESIQQASKFAGESILLASKLAGDGFQRAQQFTTEETKEISRVLNENYKQTQPYIDEAKNEVSRLLHEQYEVVQPYMQEAVNEISDVLNERYQQAVPFLQNMADLSYERGEKYQKAMLDILAVDSEPSQILIDLKERIVSSALEYKLQYRADHLPDINYVPTIPYDKLDAVFDSLSMLVQTDGWTLRDLLQNLNFEDLGGFYSGCIVGSFLIASLVLKSKTPPMIFTPTLKTQQMVTKGIVPTESASRLTEEKMRLERLVSDLTIAVTALSKELRVLKEEKAKTEYALATMKSDVRMLQNAIQATDLTERQLKKQTEESALMETELQAHLRDAEMKVQALEIEKHSLQLEINDLSGENVRVLEPKPPATIPPPVAQKNVSGVWFANFVSNVAS
jgi:hypothetical protein